MRGVLVLFAALVWVGAAAAQSPDAGERRPVIGAALAPAETRDDVAGVVTDVRPGYPAALAGLQVGDLIESVDGVALRSPADAAAALAAFGAADAPDTLRLGVLRAGAALSVDVTPWLTPDPARDAALFPYPDDAPPQTAFMARIADGDYAHVSPGRVFSAMRVFGLDDSLLNRRIAFRARVRSCGDIAALRGPAETPDAEISPGLELIPSLLFDPTAAAEQRTLCAAHFEASGLLYSSPLVVVAGRFVDDADAMLSEGGEIFLADAVLFDHATVSMGEEIVSFVELMARMGLFSP